MLDNGSPEVSIFIAGSQAGTAVLAFPKVMLQPLQKSTAGGGQRLVQEGRRDRALACRAGLSWSNRHAVAENPHELVERIVSERRFDTPRG